MDYMAKARALVSRMTLEEKAALTTGADFWHLKGIERLGLAGQMVTDGPHGLRKQAGEADHVGINDSVPATCFPTASATACSFDRELLREIGTALGEECREEDVAVLLGPGVNIKRSPLCGRNFEYFSEDPYLAGELAAGFINGVQSQGVGTSLKHFALNDQETRRMTSESVCDERAMREIYLAAFERAVRQSQPWTVMHSYNRLNGEYAGDCKYLLTDILRGEWGFEGLVVSDWGGTNDHVAGIRAGADLAMPGPEPGSDRAVAAAVRSGALDVRSLDESAARVTALLLRAAERKSAPDTKQEHHALARRAARESAVLLKNDGLLPGNAAQSAAVIGAFAKSPRYQGAGSSKINPTRLDSAYDALTALGLGFDYADGYSLDSDEPDAEKIAEARRAAAGKEIVYIFAGLPDSYESEGFDRKKLTIPLGQMRLIEEVSAVNPNTVVVLMGGGVMDMAWEGRVRAILLAGLGGQAGGGAAAELLLGLANPCGKLAETWCVKLEDNPSYGNFPGYEKSVEYRESIYVGYRYYDAAKKPVRYPFGHGLSYTSFAYDGLRIDGDLKTGLTVTCGITNTGGAAGAEAAQLYITPPESAVFRAEQELKGFARVELSPGERREVSFPLCARDFAFYDVNVRAWRVTDGEYGIRVGASSRDIRLTGAFSAVGADEYDAPAPDYRQSAPFYYGLPDSFANVPDAQFTALLGRPAPPRERAPGAAHTRNSTVNDIRDTRLGRVLGGIASVAARKMLGGDADMARMMDEMIGDAPLRMILMAGDGRVTSEMLDGIVDMLNGHTIRGLGKILRKKETGR